MAERQAPYVARQGDDVAPAVAEWVEPALALMRDDDDASSTVPVLGRPARTFASVQLPSSLLEHGPAIHPGTQLRQLVIVDGHGRRLPDGYQLQGRARKLGFAAGELDQRM